MRSTVAAILSAIRGLLCLVSRRNTIVAGGHVLRECSKCSYGAELWLILMPLGTGTGLNSPRRCRRRAGGRGEGDSHQARRGGQSPIAGVLCPAGTSDSLAGAAHSLAGVPHSLSGAAHSLAGAANSLARACPPLAGAAHSLTGTPHSLARAAHSLVGAGDSLAWGGACRAAAALRGAFPDGGGRCD